LIPLQHRGRSACTRRTTLDAFSGTADISPMPWKPEGYTSLAPYLIVADPEAVLDFCVKVFDAERLRVIPYGDRIAHAECRIDDTVLMMGGMRGPCRAICTSTCRTPTPPSSVRSPPVPKSSNRCSNKVTVTGVAACKAGMARHGGWPDRLILRPVEPHRPTQRRPRRPSAAPQPGHTADTPAPAPGLGK
jgi:hypothetical protein